MTDDEIFSLEKRCKRGEVVLVNPKDWRIYDIFMEENGVTVTVHRCIDSEAHEEEPAWQGNVEQVVEGEWNQLFFNNEMTLFVYKELRNYTTHSPDRTIV